MNSWSSIASDAAASVPLNSALKVAQNDDNEKTLISPSSLRFWYFTQPTVDSFLLPREPVAKTRREKINEKKKNESNSTCDETFYIDRILRRTCSGEDWETEGKTGAKEDDEGNEGNQTLISLFQDHVDANGCVRLWLEANTSPDISRERNCYERRDNMEKKREISEDKKDAKELIGKKELQVTEEKEPLKEQEIDNFLISTEEIRQQHIVAPSYKLFYFKGKASPLYEVLMRRKKMEFGSENLRSREEKEERSREHLYFNERYAVFPKSPRFPLMFDVPIAFEEDVQQIPGTQKNLDSTDIILHLKYLNVQSKKSRILDSSLYIYDGNYFV